MRQANQLSDGINLVPLAGFGEIDGVLSRQLMLNVLLGVPFGLALPFLGARSARRIVALGLVFAVTIELIQLAIDAAYQFGYRTVDVNDVITNVAGVIVGVGSFRLLQLAYRAMKFDAQDVGSYLDTVLSAR